MSSIVDAPTSMLLEQLQEMDQHMQCLVLGQQEYTRNWLHQNGRDQSMLAAWLAAEVRVEPQEPWLAALGASRRDVWIGWRHYMAGDYCAANLSFMAAAEAADHGHELAAAALGLGKVYTRSGHWEQARRWLLLALNGFRQGQRLFDLVQAYGALGEVFLRAGQPQAAHTCFLASLQLLPPGNAQQPRQLNYLASTLLRCGAVLRAESLLMTCLHSARDLDDVASVWHALARLQRLYAAQPGGETVDVLARYAHSVPATQVAVAVGLLQLSRAQVYWQANDAETAMNALSLAQVAFSTPGQQLPCERVIAQRLSCALAGKAVVDDAALLELLEMPAKSAPGEPALVDLSLARLPLPTNNGFAALAGPLRDITTEFANIDRLFL